MCIFTRLKWGGVISPIILRLTATIYKSEGQSRPHKRIIPRNIGTRYIF
jgi:hypothetical protein